MTLTDADAIKLIQQLRGRIWHTTSIEGLRGIVSDQCIRVNRGDLSNAYFQSKCSNCFEEGAVSLFDLVTHRDTDLVGDDLDLLGKWPQVMFRHFPTVFLGMNLHSLAPNLLFYPELKRRRGLGGIIPRIEICHVGDIPFGQVLQVGIWRQQAPLNIEFFPTVEDAIGLLHQ